MFDQVNLTQRILGILERGEDIPFAVRNAANQLKINIELLKEIVKDVQVKHEERTFITEESNEADLY